MTKEKVKRQLSLLERLAWFLVGAVFKVFFFVVGKVKVDPRLQETLALYEGGGAGEVFSQVRVWDAPFEEVEKCVPKTGVILDLGCGDGLLANFLALSGSGRKVVGIEVNEERLVVARKGIRNVRFEVGDVLKKKIPRADVILLVHVLHHLASYGGQEKLLKECEKSLAKKGKLIIVEIGERPILKCAVTWLTDAVLYPMLFEKGVFRKFYYRRREAWVKMVKGLGLEAGWKEAHHGKPFSHVIIWGEKR